MIGIGIAGTGFGVLIGAVSRASPPEKRSERVGMVAASGSIGTAVIAPLGQFLSGNYGWKAAVLGFTVIAGVAALLSLLIKEEKAAIPAGPPQHLSAAVARRVAPPRLHAHDLAYFACGFQLIFLTTHLPTYLELCGVAPGVGATALGLIGFFNAIGTYMFGLSARATARRSCWRSSTGCARSSCACSSPCR